MASLGGAIGGAGGATSSNGQALLSSLSPMAAKSYNYTGKPAIGTGIQQLIAWARTQNLLTDGTVKAIIPEVSGLFGGYPENNQQERGPDILFIVLFAILFAAHLGMWMFNFSRKQNFFLQLGFAFFCALKVIGFSCRLAWSTDVTQLNIGLCSLVFIQVAQLILESLNMVLAHRIFTWRHPETGTRWFIVHFINLIYFLVLAVIVMAILGQALPYIYFMGEKHYSMCRRVMKAAAILNIFYASLPVLLILLAYILPPGTIVSTPRILRRNQAEGVRSLPMVYQASWIKSAGLLYYPEKNSQVNIYKGEPYENAVRIIPSREPPGNGHKQLGQPVHPDAPHFHWAVLTVTITSVTLVMNTAFRVAACFRTGPWATLVNFQEWKVNFWPHRAYVMFIFYGATEVLVLSFYLLMRIDLRFYIPDMPHKPPKGGIPKRNLENGDGAWTEDYEKESNTPESSRHQVVYQDA